MEDEPQRIFRFDQDSPESLSVFGGIQNWPPDTLHAHRIGLTIRGRQSHPKVLLGFVFGLGPDDYPLTVIDIEVHQAKDLHKCLGELLDTLPSEPSDEE